MVSIAISGLVRQRRIVPLVIVALLLGGCGGGGPPSTQQRVVSINPPGEAGVTPRPTAEPQAPAIQISSAAVNPGAMVTIDLTLLTAGLSIAGAQADVSFPTGIHLAARSNGGLDCTVNPDINKSAASVTPQPVGCELAVCTGMRILVWAPDNVDPIPDGSVIFTCRMRVDFDAAGTLTLTAGQVIMSDPRGSRLDGEGRDGVITVSGSPLPTPDPLSAAAVELNRVAAPPGTRVDVDATLHTNGAAIAAVQFDIAFAPQARIHTKANGKPDCQGDPEIDKDRVSFAFRPVGCAGDECTSARALVFSDENNDAVPDGSVLVTCRVDIAADAVGPYPLTVSGVVVGDPSVGSYIQQFPRYGTGAEGIDGSITVGAATPTPAVSLTHASIVLDQVAGAANSVVDLDAILVLPNGEIVAGTQNDITFPRGARVAATVGGKPDCRANPGIGKGNTQFVFQPPLCTADTCTGMRSFVISFAPVEDARRLIPSGAVLYTCRLEIAADAEGVLPLPVSFVVMSDPDGNATPGAQGVDGHVTVTPP